MKAEIIEKYQCGLCSTWYADDDAYNDEEAERNWPSGALDAEEAADECCKPETQRGYFCSVCSKHFYRHKDAEKHLKEPHGSSELVPAEAYIDLLVEGLPPLEAWNESHRQVDDDRRIIEEVLLGESVVGAWR